MKVVGYVRVSTEEATQGVSLQAKLRQYCDLYGHDPAEREASRSVAKGQDLARTSKV
ncbi:hypothetical protein IV102_25175 [bacterium]|nr:hypothetical protein [bacterium]